MTDPRYPRPISSIHQIEISSRCNLKCRYCPSPKLDKPKEKGGHERAKIDITEAHYRRALEHAKHFEARGTQRELALTGIGEALLHPQFVDFLRLAREALPDNPITFSTNGLLLNDELCERIKPYDPQVFVSNHRPEKAHPAKLAAQRAGILSGENHAYESLDGAFDWAGQVDWEVTIPEKSVDCAYLGVGWCVVLSDGRITTCCLDASGAGTVGHVDDEPGSLSVAPFDLCKSCHMNVPEPLDPVSGQPLPMVP